MLPQLVIINKRFKLAVLHVWDSGAEGIVVILQKVSGGLYEADARQADACGRVRSVKIE
jgi:hypothetical protein